MRPKAQNDETKVDNEVRFHSFAFLPSYTASQISNKPISNAFVSRKNFLESSTNEKLGGKFFYFEHSLMFIASNIFLRLSFFGKLFPKFPSPILTNTHFLMLLAFIILSAKRHPAHNFNFSKFQQKQILKDPDIRDFPSSIFSQKTH